MKESTDKEYALTQKAFRAVLDSMSKPGKASVLPKLEYSHVPDGLNPHVLTVLKTLCDENVSIGFDRITDPRLSEYVRVNTGSRIEDIGSCDYACFSNPGDLSSLASCKTGTIELPEKGATCIISVDAIFTDEKHDFAGTAFSMEGPGISAKKRVAVSGLDPDFVGIIGKVNDNFPVGVDVVLVDRRGAVVCVPRTSKLERL